MHDSEGRKLLDRFLRRSGVTRQSFAEAAGITGPMLSHILAGRRRATLAVACAFERLSDGKVPVQSWIRNGTTG